MWGRASRVGRVAAVGPPGGEGSGPCALLVGGKAGEAAGPRRRLRRGPAAWCGCSVARLLRPATVGGAAGRRELPAGLRGGDTALLAALFDLDLRRLLDRLEEPADGATGTAHLVHPLGHRSAAVGQ